MRTEEKRNGGRAVEYVNGRCKVTYGFILFCTLSVARISVNDIWYIIYIVVVAPLKNIKVSSRFKKYLL